MDTRRFWLYWQLLLPGGGRKAWQLIEYFGSPKEAWLASEADLSAVPFLGPEKARALVNKRNNLPLERIIDYLNNIKCSFFTIDDDNYPSMLKNIYDPPPAIFVKGKLPEHDKVNVAIVGSRVATHYGIAAAEVFAKELAELGLVIVSGMARGIDTAAHRGALQVKGQTIAVLGCGPDVVYPRENKRLMFEIIENGAIITEFPPGTQPLPWHFPCRNRIISGLCHGVVVVEADERSGALITADCALEQGREVFALPGNVTSKKSTGTNKLIRQGAQLVTGTAEILEGLGLGQLSISNAPKDAHSLGLGKLEMLLWSVLSDQPLSFEQVIEKTGLLPQEVAATLTVLEIKGLIKTIPGKLFVRSGL